MTTVDTRERYPYRFAGQSVQTIRATVSAGDYAVTAADGSVAIVVEARYSALFKLEHVNGNWLADQLARLQVRYPEVQLTFADSRPHAEDWTYRFLTAALADGSDPTD